MKLKTTYKVGYRWVNSMNWLGDFNEICKDITNLKEARRIRNMHQRKSDLYYKRPHKYLQKMVILQTKEVI